jgi:NhaP-type Na+/H+ or K+/H+ antiporter
LFQRFFAGYSSSWSLQNMYENLAIMAGCVFLYSIVSGGLERTPVNGALVFILCGIALGPVGLGVLNLNVEREGLRTLAELTLALVLFTDAANANLGVLKKSFHIPQRLLLIGLPLTILLGFAAGALLFDTLTVFEVAILATMLAPTDAALGQAVVTNESVPANMREGLNVESGLNDGICVPILFVFLALAAGTGSEGSTSAFALKLVAEEIGIGLAVGACFTVLGTWLIRQFSIRGWITDTWRQLPVVALSIVCFAVAQFLGGSGFIACFAGGLLFGAMAKSHKQPLLMAAEGTGDTLALITWVVFGVAVVGPSLGSFSWEVVLYALLSLTIVRMLPVFLVLTGMGLGAGEKLFMGWFGPRGLASIVFAVIVFGEQLPGGETIAITVTCTIVFSVLAHGLSANPLVSVLVKKVKHTARL